MKFSLGLKEMNLGGFGKINRRNQPSADPGRSRVGAQL